MGSITAFSSNPSMNPTPSDAHTFTARATQLEIDEERYRSRVNLLGAIVAVLLIAAGWWIVNSLATT
jgi:hypothetical protein